jgi:hypothetical protein
MAPSKIAIAFLFVALAVTIGLLGVWPTIHGAWASAADRREKAKIAAAWSNYDHDPLCVSGCDIIIARIHPHYLPHRALIEVRGEGCALVAEPFGTRIDSEDVQPASCE